ncbi:DVU3141 family protein [Halomonas nitroreducens]|uniref:Uncharacterized protein n=1 Tax=Halomonas nitroreducens TaxID=447425 RepID=A0A431UYN8_9GAMM|nr:DVU3141 family protein [Halomonas nitroreducens]RTQ97932.1 hypothetical protein EKG36_19665 [Halomonas nitroreducens]
MDVFPTLLSRRRAAAGCLPGWGAALLVVLSLGLSGCSSLSATPPAETGSVMAGGAHGRALDANLSGFLAQSAPEAVTTLATSPWGPGVTVRAEAPYHAASGRTCRRLHIEGGGSGQARQAVACESPDGWQSRRLVTQSAGGQQP